MMDDEHDNEKPLAHIRRKKHDTDGKFACMHGHTARKRMDTSNDCSVERSSKAQFARPHDGSTPELARGYVMTEFELAGFEVETSLHDRKAWERIPELLSTRSLALPLTRKSADGKIVQTVKLEARGLILPDARVATEQQQLKREIYTVTGDVRGSRPGRKRRSWRWRLRGLKLHATVPHAAPEKILDPLLPMRLTCPSYVGKAPQSAIVRTDHVHAAFYCAFSGGRPLEIDLGHNCRVSAVSTQGRHPATRRYPHTSHSKEEGWVVEGQPDWDPSKPYRGPFWTVIATENDRKGTNGGHPAQMLQPQFVTRYQLLWRADGTRCPWHSLGEFQGNTDECSEVAHMLAHHAGVGKEGLVCRHLRIIPLHSQGGGALRVGVYGVPVDVHGKRRVGLGDQRATATATTATATHDEEYDETVKYTITAPGASYNSRFCNSGSSGMWLKCNCSWCRGDMFKPSVRRRAQRQQAAEEVRDLRRAFDLVKVELEGRALRSY